MALIKMGQLISEARGKHGGSVFSRNTYGAILRQKVSPIQPCTSAQLAVRAALAAMAQAWRGLTEAQRASWILTAPSFARTNVFGDKVPYTGFNLYGYLNRMRQVIGLPLLTSCPQPQAVSGLTSLGLSVAAAVPTYSITFSPSPVPADMYIVFYASPGLSQGITFIGANLRVLGVAPPATASPVNALADFEELFGAPVEGDKYTLQAIIVNGPSGITSTLSQVQVIGAA